MTTELEKTFFDTFGIEPMPYCCYHDCNCPINDIGKFNSKCPKQAVTKECDVRIMQKPQITDRILLELICIANKAYIDLEGTDIETIKNSLLENFIFFRRDVYDDIRTLFEEG